MMLRDLATVLEDLQAGMQVTAARAGVRVVQAAMTLPVDIAFVFKDGGCALLADVARNAADASWIQARSRLTLSWSEVSTEALP